MDLYKENIQSDGSLEKLKLRIVVRGDLQNIEIIGDIWNPTVSMMILKYLLADDAKNKVIARQLGFIVAFLQANIKHIVFAKLDIRYGEYLPEYAYYLEYH